MMAGTVARPATPATPFRTVLRETERVSMGSAIAAPPRACPTKSNRFNRIVCTEGGPCQGFCARSVARCGIPLTFASKGGNLCRTKEGGEDTHDGQLRRIQRRRGDARPPAPGLHPRARARGRRRSRRRPRPRTRRVGHDRPPRPRDPRRSRAAREGPRRRDLDRRATPSSSRGSPPSPRSSRPRRTRSPMRPPPSSNPGWRSACRPGRRPTPSPSDSPTSPG